MCRCTAGECRSADACECRRQYLQCDMRCDCRGRCTNRPHCGCSSQLPCASNRCSCRKAGLACEPGRCRCPQGSCGNQQDPTLGSLDDSSMLIDDSPFDQASSPVEMNALGLHPSVQPPAGAGTVLAASTIASVEMLTALEFQNQFYLLGSTRGLRHKGMFFADASMVAVNELFLSKNEQRFELEGNSQIYGFWESLFDTYHITLHPETVCGGAAGAGSPEVVLFQKVPDASASCGYSPGVVSLLRIICRGDVHQDGHPIGVFVQEFILQRDERLGFLGIRRSMLSCKLRM